MKKQNVKLSIIIPNYNNEKYLDRSVQYMLEQTYQNVEIIIVNDGSPGNSDELVQKYMSDERIKYIKHEKNKGLFQARLTGADAATGDYIGFLDADDYATIDFYRTLVQKAEDTNSDIVIGNTIMEYDNGKKEIFNLNEFAFDELENENCLKEYFRQEGLNFSWHTIWNKIYSMKVWKKARNDYSRINKRLIMTEDFAFSTVLFYYAKKITKVQNDGIFYCQHESTSTSVSDINYNKCVNNINDLLTSFNFVEEFLKSKNVFSKYKEKFVSWKALYENMHRGYIDNAKKLTKKEKEELNKKLDEYSNANVKINNANFFASVQTKWDDGLERIKRAIISDKTKVVSFDIFDTAVVRPFFKPTDLFSVLNLEYRKHNDTGIDFSKMRIQAEENARNKIINNTIEDITIDEIYDEIESEYKIDSKILETLKEKEKEQEIFYCKKRNTTFELYQLALSANKMVAFTSDMYLDRKTIESILKNNGYNDYSYLFISCEERKTKWSTQLYKVLMDKTKSKPEEIIHIGDNYESDYLKPHKMGINSYHFDKTTNLFINRNHTNELSQMLTNCLPFWFDTRESMEFLGIRTMIAMASNYYFDNPFRPFNNDTDFNADPFLIGYYCMGMYLYSVTNWLLKNVDGKYDTVSFMARDGYLPMKSYEILKKYYKNAPKEKYMYVSRKALIPVMISEKLDMYKLSEVFNYDNYTPSKIYKYISCVIDADEEKYKKILSEHKIDYNRTFKDQSSFYKFITVLNEKMYNQKLIDSNRKKIKKYYDEIFEEKPAAFDVGYSGRPEYYMSKLCDKKVGTFFLNINKDEACDYARRGGFELKTFFPSKPTLTGNAYELLVSKQSASCIAYDLSKDKVKPVFEKYEEDYAVAYPIEIIQSAALKFVEDMSNIFGNYLDILYYEDYYCSLPILAFFNSSRLIDRMSLSSIVFEDDIRSGEENKRMIDDMKTEGSYKNQQELSELLENTSTGIYNQLNYNKVDLTKIGKGKRLLYYLLFDKETFNRRMSEIKHKFKK